MGRPGTSRRGATPPEAHGSDSGGGRLDPVRWRRPGRGMLLRPAAVAVLLGTAALMSWSPPPGCGDEVGAGAAARAASTSAGVDRGAEPDGGSPTGDRASETPSSGTAPAGPRAPDAAAQAAAASAAAGGSPAVPSGSLGVPVRLADPTALALVRAGNRVDLRRLDDADGRTTSVAASALVLRVTGAGDPTGGLLLALTPAEAERAVATPGHGFAVLVRPD